ncbi:MAG TPA: ATP synthase F0 subunit B [Candidatus Cybelea sp.]|jgi:F-type H+-transporting ATPase subunit b|nr:ATP synthase F0 subunit B [Candidatus Cybelea sp.]
MSFLSVNGTLVVQLINFAIFFAVLYVVFLRPVAAAISRRRQYINSLVSDYDRYQAEAATLRAQAEEVRASARREAEHRVAAQRAAASNEAAEISTGFSQRARDAVERAQATVRTELEEARAEEPQAVQGLADFMLDRVIPEAAR